MSDRSRRGFTLIEVLLVLAVAAIVITLAAPSMREMMARERLKGVAGELVTGLQYGRSEAIARNTPVTLRFQQLPDKSMSCYVIYTGSVGSCDCTLTPGSACSQNAGDNVNEIRTTQIAKSTDVQVVTNPPQVIYTFALQPSGLRAAGPNLVATVLRISPVAGQIQVMMNVAGRPSLCTPPGQSVAGVAAC